METKLNLNLYKIFLGITKYIPITLAGLFTLQFIFNYYEISTEILQYFGGISIPFLALLYLISMVFQYCYLYRIPLYYLTTVDVISFIDKYYTLPIDTLTMYRIYCIIAGIFLILYIYLEYKKHKSPT